MTPEQKDRIVEAAVKWEKRLDSSMASAWWPETRALQSAVRAAEPKRLRVRSAGALRIEHAAGKDHIMTINAPRDVVLIGVESFEVLEP